MRITITQSTTTQHTGACTTTSVNMGGEVLTGSDDQSVWKWNLNCEPLGKVCDLDAAVTVVTVSYTHLTLPTICSV